MKNSLRNRRRRKASRPKTANDANYFGNGCLPADATNYGFYGGPMGGARHGARVLVL